MIGRWARKVCISFSRSSNNGDAGCQGGLLRLMLQYGSVGYSVGVKRKDLGHRKMRIKKESTASDK